MQGIPSFWIYNTFDDIYREFSIFIDHAFASSSVNVAVFIEQYWTILVNNAHKK